MIKKLLVLFFTCIATYATDVTFGWKPSPTVDLTLAYNFYMSIGGSGPFVLYTTTQNTNVTVTGLTTGVYRFYATATNIIGESVPSNTLQIPGNRPSALVMNIITITNTP